MCLKDEELSDGCDLRERGHNALLVLAMAGLVWRGRLGVPFTAGASGHSQLLLLELAAYILVLLLCHWIDR